MFWIFFPVVGAYAPTFWIKFKIMYYIATLLYKVGKFLNSVI
jgi:hypothetical protein